MLLRGGERMDSSGRQAKTAHQNSAEIAQTGAANSVRIVWNEEGNAAELDTAIAQRPRRQADPIVEHHSATGKLPDVPPRSSPTGPRATSLKYSSSTRPALLLNIANEAGDDKVTQERLRIHLPAAITAIRGTGFKAPLLIDAPQWGQDIDRLQASGPALITADPLHNLMFSVHMWWSDPQGTR